MRVAIRIFSLIQYDIRGEKVTLTKINFDIEILLKFLEGYFDQFLK